MREPSPCRNKPLTLCLSFPDWNSCLLTERPWLVDSYTKWLQRLKVRKVLLLLPLGVETQSLDLPKKGGHQRHWAYCEVGVAAPAPPPSGPGAQV